MEKGGKETLSFKYNVSHFMSCHISFISFGSIHLLYLFYSVEGHRGLLGPVSAVSG